MPDQIPVAFGDAGWDGVNVEDNTIYGGSLFTFDTYDSSNALFRNNIVHVGSPFGGYCGIVGGGYHWKDWRVFENQFYLHPVMNQGIVVNGNVVNMEISGNWFFAEGDARGLAEVPILNLHGSGIVLRSNRFDPQLAKLFQGRVSIARDNVFFDGRLVDGIGGNVRSH